MSTVRNTNKYPFRRPLGSRFRDTEDQILNFRHIIVSYLR